MSLKAELQTWVAALKAFDASDFPGAMELFSRIADSSKILTNMGLVCATVGDHERAVKHFREATKLDPYLAVAYFQCGVSNFLLSRFGPAYQDFEEALLRLRSNQTIHYEQLGLQFKLHSAEVHFNIGLSLIHMGRLEDGLGQLHQAASQRAAEDHSVIEDAIRDRGKGYTVFSIPLGILYRPPEKKIKNVVQKDYMGKAKLVASSDPTDKITTFTGSARLKMGPSSGGPGIARSATISGPFVAQTRSPNAVRSAGLDRANTMLDVPSNARELAARRGFAPPTRAFPRSAGPTLGRSNTQILPSRPSAQAHAGGPIPELLARRQRSVSSLRTARGYPDVPSEPVLDIYDEYLGPDDDADLPPVPTLQPAPPGGGNRAASVANWARQNTEYQAPPVLPLQPQRPPPNAGLSRSRSTSNLSPSDQYYQGGAPRRRLTRRGTGRSARSKTPSPYEEEEGYESGGFDDGPMEMNIIRVKLHYQDEIRGMTLSPTTSWLEFGDKLSTKFNRGIGGLRLKFKDEDGGMISMRDDSDFDMAIETAREFSQGRAEGKLEIWCTDI